MNRTYLTLAIFIIVLVAGLFVFLSSKSPEEQNKDLYFYKYSFSPNIADPGKAINLLTVSLPGFIPLPIISVWMSGGDLNPNKLFR